MIDQLLLERYEPIAIVGAGLRLPGGNETLDGLADFFRAGRSGVGPLPTDRWDSEAYRSTDPKAPGTIRSAGGGFLDGLDEFDPKFFNISPKEARYVDPQQRLAMEVSWEALENANIDPTGLRHGNGGVYMAVSNMDYAAEMSLLPPDQLNSHVGTGMAHSAVCGRISYFLGWRGPSISVDTACSASLVALHLAVQGLRLGECDIALCGGVNTIHSPRGHIIATQGNMLAPDGVCKTFDAAADGYCRSEGGAALVLKRLSAAQRDGDRILALVRGSAVRQDGESGALMVPNGIAQEALLRAALANAMLDPADISYVEAHGTGTALGDPIEIGALSAVFSASHSPDDPLPVASAKTNLGHMEAAAGMGGVLKTVLQLQHATIFPHLNLTTPSPQIPWERAPVTVPVEVRPWTAPVRRAMVSSFGFAGTIASVVLEQAPPAPRRPEGRPQEPAERPSDEGGHLFAVSAKSERSLRTQIERYRRYLVERPEVSVRDVCYTSTVGRAHFGVRRAGVVRDHDELVRLLDRQPTQGGSPGPARQVAFLFSGGGSQYVGMGRPLYRQFPVFREQLDACDELFAPHLGRSIRAMLLGEAADAESLHDIVYMQPALFAVEYALARLWLSCGIRPSVLLGHSAGEIVAAAVAGLLSLADAATLTAVRGRLMAATPAGAMLAVEAPAAEAEPLAARYPDVSLAAVNGPDQVVLSGDRESLARLAEVLAERDIRAKRLAISCASHSPLMAGVFDDFRAVLAGMRWREPELTIISNVTGAPAGAREMADPEYWVRHLGQPVRFADGMAAIERRGPHVFLEVGPATDLVGMGKQCVDAAEHRWLSSLHPDDHDGSVLRHALAQLYSAGAPVRWDAFHHGRSARKVPLPTYAFDRRRYWLPSTAAGAGASGGAATHPLLGRETSTERQRMAGSREFATRIGRHQPAYLGDHAVMGRLVFPAAGYVEMLLALQDAVYGETDHPISALRIHEALFLAEAGRGGSGEGGSGERGSGGTDELTEVRTRWRADPDGTATVEIVSVVAAGGDGFERLHVTATIAARGNADGPAGSAGWDALEGELRALAAAAGGPDRDAGADELYAAFTDAGVDYGPTFRLLRGVGRHGATLALGELHGADGLPAGHLPPAVLDSALQTLLVFAEGDDVSMPVLFEGCRLFKKPRGERLRSVLRLTPDTEPGSPPRADLLLLEGERSVFLLRGLALRTVTNASAAARRRLFFQPRWVKRALPTTPAPTTPMPTPAGRAPRHALMVHRSEADFAPLADRLAGTGMRLSFAASGADAGVVLRERPTDVCWFWRPEPGPPGLARLRVECARNYSDLLVLLRLLDEVEFGRTQRLWLVTTDAQRLPGDRPDSGEHLAAASLWGFGQVLWTEHPAYRASLVDLPPDADGHQHLLAELLAAEPAEFQLAYRDGRRHVRRIFPVDLSPPPPGGLALVADAGDIGPADEAGADEAVTGVPAHGGAVRMVAIEDQPPVGDQVQVRVHAAGLNFKDVLNRLGLHRRYAEREGAEFPPLPLGLECAGTILAAGPDATFAVGAEVIVAHPGCLRERVTAPSAMVFAKPARLSFAEAAGLPTAYLTAYHALHDLAGIRPGDRVLVHAAAGGVGQAAVRLCQLAGAEVFATASPAKWPLLHSQGVRHVLNSRSVDFAEEILARTDDAGVDVVLNSLAREFIPAGLRALGTGGRFVELGKMGVWTEQEVHRERPDVAYHHFDFGEFPPERMHPLCQRVLGTVLPLVASGALDPAPTTVYTVDEVADAFSALARGSSVGKLVVSFVDDTATVDSRPLAVGPDETYVITGGLGALGRVTLSCLAGLGARHFALVGRTVKDGAAEEIEAELGRGVRVTVHRGDLGDAVDTARVVAELSGLDPPVAGIIHAAGVLADAPVATQTWAGIDEVFQAKVYGSWLLHEAGRSLPGLRFFVGYSSVAALVGSRGQANYAAANAFLDALMQWRAACGLPGISVNWGAWGEVGLAAEMSEQHIRGVQDQGFTFFSPATGARALTRVLGRPLPQVIVAEVDFGRYAATRSLPNALYERVARRAGETGHRLDLDELRSRPAADRVAALEEFIRASIAELLHFDAAEVDTDARFFELGMDSLAAVELKNTLERTVHAPLATSTVFDHPSVAQLAAHLADRLGPAPEEGA